MIDIKNKQDVLCKSQYTREGLDLLNEYYFDGEHTIDEFLYRALETVDFKAIYNHYGVYIEFYPVSNMDNMETCRILHSSKPCKVNYFGTNFSYMFVFPKETSVADAHFRVINLLAKSRMSEVSVAEEKSECDVSSDSPEEEHFYTRNLRHLSDLNLWGFEDLKIATFDKWCEFFYMNGIVMKSYGMVDGAFLGKIIPNESDYHKGSVIMQEGGELELREKMIFQALFILSDRRKSKVYTNIEVGSIIQSLSVFPK